MRTPMKTGSRVRSLSAIAVLSALLLGGCSAIEDVALDDSYKKDTVAERYPIKVKKATAKVGVSAPSGQLKPDQINGVVAFANDAKTMSVSAISIKYPSGSSTSRDAARQMVEIIVDQGVPENMIKVASYPGGSTQPIQMSFTRKVAVTKECGDWSDNIAEDARNRQYKNFGCAYQHNMAAMVANPEDFERPRSMGPVLAGNRMVVMQVYLTNKTAGDFFTLDKVGD